MVSENKSPDAKDNLRDENKKDDANYKNENTQVGMVESEQESQKEDLKSDRLLLEEINRLKGDFEKCKQESLYQRAEFENTKKRMVREQESSIRFANERFFGDFLSIIDLFEKAMAHGSKLKSKDSLPELDNFLNGIELTKKEMLQLLSRNGVEFIGQKGEYFDPFKHEAVTEINCKKEEENTILEVIKVGCLLHGRLLKPAQVVVGKKT